ncbi:MAG: hypothetical protein V1493_01890 [Candidatus Diapherotrites archaeon]
MNFLKLGQKGQAFSTFKLLIAAIVAVVILVILLSILGLIDFNPQTKPIEGAAELLKQADQTTYALVTSDQSVTFTRTTQINTKAILDKSGLGLTEDLLCLSLGDYSQNSQSDGEGLSNFVGTEKNLAYNANGRIGVKLSALCAEGSELEGILDDSQNDVNPKIGGSWAAHCTCVTEADLQPQTCCVIMLRYAT